MKTYRCAALLAVACALMAIEPIASASTVYDLDFNGCSGTNGCGTPPYGTVTLSQDGSDVLVTLALNSGIGIVQTGASDALLFDLDVSGAVITNLTSGFMILPSGGSAAGGIGDFSYGVDCGGATPACGPGSSKTAPGVSFDVGLSSGTLTPGDFISNGKYFFASDIIGLTGNTGPVGSDGPGCSGPECGPHGTPTIPEPMSLLLMGTGLIAIFFVRRRKRT